MRWPLTLACTLTATALAGCGNVFESFSMGNWEEVGLEQTPQLRGKGEFLITTLAAGNGRYAKAGDLVKAEALVTTPRFGGAALPPRTARTIWIWLGEAGSPP